MLKYVSEIFTQNSLDGVHFLNKELIGSTIYWTTFLKSLNFPKKFKQSVLKNKI